MPTDLRAKATGGAPNMSLARLSGMVGGSSTLASGDLLNVSVLSGLEDEVTDKPARVGEDGAINVPLVGMVQVAGMDEQQAAEMVRTAAIERGIYRDPQVTLQIAERATNSITVLGAVTNPGTHKVPRSSSNLIAAIAAAGGFSEEAGTEVELLRQPRKFLANEQPASESNIQLASFNAPPLEPQQARSERIDLAMVGQAPRNYSIGDQDVVMVHPAAKRVIHVAGLVRQPDQFEMPNDQDLHVLDAIAMAGGQSSPVADKVFVIRRADEKSEPKVIQVSISSAKVNGNENLRLAAGDLVSVESTMITSVVDTLSNVFRVTAGLGGNVFSL